MTVYYCPKCEADKGYVSKGKLLHLTCPKCGSKINYVEVLSEDESAGFNSQILY